MDTLFIEGNYLKKEFFKKKERNYDKKSKSFIYGKTSSWYLLVIPSLDKSYSLKFSNLFSI